MASMEDLIATISGGMHVGQQANDLKDLQAKLSQTLNPTIPNYRPVPPSNSYNNANTNAAVPPAPASSWNSPPPANSFLSSSPYAARQMGYNANGNGNSNGNSNGNVNGGGRRDVGFSIAEAAERAQRDSNQNQNQNQNSSNGVNVNGTRGQDRPYHAEVLPERASPAKTDGFADDAFKPIWERDHTKNGAFTKSR